MSQSIRAVLQISCSVTFLDQTGALCVYSGKLLFHPERTAWAAVGGKAPHVSFSWEVEQSIAHITPFDS